MVIVAAVSIAVWMTVFPILLIRGPAGAFSGEEGALLCLAGGEDYADTDVVRFVRRFHYLGIRAEVKTGSEGELCFLLTLARRIPQAADAILRKGELRVFPLHANQASLFPEAAAVAAGLTKNDDQRLGPKWSATSTGPVHRLLDQVQEDLSGAAYTYCRLGRCTAVLAEPELLASSDDVMAAFPIKSETAEPAILLRLTPPALQRITQVAGEDGAQLVFVMDGQLLAVAMTPPPKADGQVTVPLDRDMTDVEFEAAILAAVLTSGPIDGKWQRTELQLTSKSSIK